MIRAVLLLLAVVACGPGSRGGPSMNNRISGPDAVEISPCGRCRQVLNELAALDASDPLVLGEGRQGTREWRLSALLPDGFGPDSLG